MGWVVGLAPPLVLLFFLGTLLSHKRDFFAKKIMCKFYFFLHRIILCNLIQQQTLLRAAYLMQIVAVDFGVQPSFLFGTPSKDLTFRKKVATFYECSSNFTYRENELTF